MKKSEAFPDYVRNQFLSLTKFDNGRSEKYSKIRTRYHTEQMKKSKNNGLNGNKADETLRNYKPIYFPYKSLLR
ncbi:hypothetical protein FAZ19_09285 [Sphingobacterium alkalisoli]|uniref:Uncharacterized protein n=1 Tax=Sphingobacterium alkalisoli TaxID=1874115 RepID=A0A4U0H6Y0_9SPHI|nr:hypothetical protein [Sphingobacterium alkalisoli]TJY67074.1 hypothetical protein FAZ19_09285 [Sphingobacterium alkalisoli]GGH12400.1 hypothetical protein GCM10011418_11930 [Sphingobacterium alkalisoli]